MEGGRAFDIHPAGMLALDVARIEAGLLLIDVDFQSSKKALIESQKYSPFEMGLGRLVDLDKARFVGQAALARGEARGHPRRDRGARGRLDVASRSSSTRSGSPPQVPAAASRVAVPVYGRAGPGREGHLDDLVADPEEADRAGDRRRRNYAAVGTNLEMELTVEAVRHRCPRTVVETPFFNPKRKTATPV